MMQYIPLLALVQLGLAATSRIDYAAVLRSGETYKFEVKRGPCVNLKRSQPTFDTLEVNYGDSCTVYTNLRCDRELEEFDEGTHAIEDLAFKSIKCAARGEL